MKYGQIEAKMPIYLYGDEKLAGSIRIQASPLYAKIFVVQIYEDVGGNLGWIDVLWINDAGKVVGGQLSDFAYVSEPPSDGLSYVRKHGIGWVTLLTAINELTQHGYIVKTPFDQTDLDENGVLRLTYETTVISILDNQQNIIVPSNIRYEPGYWVDIDLYEFTPIIGTWYVQESLGTVHTYPTLKWERF